MTTTQIPEALPVATGEQQLPDITLAPIHTGLQFQGDVGVIPATKPAPRRWIPMPVPSDGIAVVRGEAGGNTHLLLADGPCTWAPNPGAARTADDLDLGGLLVPDGAAYLAHPEHGYSGIGPGAYTLRRQRQYRPIASTFVED